MRISSFSQTLVILFLAAAALGRVLPSSVSKHHDHSKSLRKRTSDYFTGYDGWIEAPPGLTSVDNTLTMTERQMAANIAPNVFNELNFRQARSTFGGVLSHVNNLRGATPADYGGVSFNLVRQNLFIMMWTDNPSPGFMNELDPGGSNFQEDGRTFAAEIQDRIHGGRTNGRFVLTGQDSDDTRYFSISWYIGVVNTNDLPLGMVDVVPQRPTPPDLQRALPTVAAGLGVNAPPAPEWGWVSGATHAFTN